MTQGPMAAHTQAPPPPPPAPPVLVRRRGDRVVAGVCAGLGRRFGLDPVLVRVLFVVGLFGALVSLPIYLVLWLVMPQVDESAPQVEDNPQALALGAGGVALLILAIIVVWQLPLPGVLIPLLLIAVGVALWQRPSQAMAGHPAPVPVPGASWATAGNSVPAATGTATSPVHQGFAIHAAATETGNAAPAPPVAPAPKGETELIRWSPPLPRRAPSWLGPATLALALIASGILAGLGVAGVVRVHGSDVIATGLMVAAIGLVVGAFRGHAKWLAMPATVAAIAVIALELAVGIGLHIDPTVGERRIQADVVADGTVWSHGAGHLAVDLEGAEVDGANMEVHLAAGQLYLTVPWDADVVLRGEVGAGQVEFDDGTVSDSGGRVPVPTEDLGFGTLLQLDTTLRSQVTDPQQLVVELHVGVGSVEIDRATPEAPSDGGN